MPCTIQVCTNSHRSAFCWKWTQRSVLRLLLLLLLYMNLCCVPSTECLAQNCAYMNQCCVPSTECSAHTCAYMNQCCLASTECLAHNCAYMNQCCLPLTECLAHNCAYMNQCCLASTEWQKADEKLSDNSSIIIFFSWHSSLKLLHFKKSLRYFYVWSFPIPHRCCYRKSRRT